MTEFVIGYRDEYRQIRNVAPIESYGLDSLLELQDLIHERIIELQKEKKEMEQLMNTLVVHNGLTDPLNWFEGKEESIEVLTKLTQENQELGFYDNPPGPRDE